MTPDNTAACRALAIIASHTTVPRDAMQRRTLLRSFDILSALAVRDDTADGTPNAE